MKRLALYQSRDEYPSLHLMVTDNSRYLQGRRAVTRDEALALIAKWIDDNLRSSEA